MSRASLVTACPFVVRLRSEMDTPPADPEHLAITAIAETHASMRLSREESVRQMRESLERHGQLTSITAYRDADRWEVVDGFKRLRAARELQWTHVRVRVIACDATSAIASIMVLNASMIPSMVPPCCSSITG